VIRARARRGASHSSSASSPALYGCAAHARVYSGASGYRRHAHAHAAGAILVGIAMVGAIAHSQNPVSHCAAGRRGFVFLTTRSEPHGADGPAEHRVSQLQSPLDRLLGLDLLDPMVAGFVIDYAGHSARSTSSPPYPRAIVTLVARPRGRIEAPTAKAAKRNASIAAHDAGGRPDRNERPHRAAWVLFGFTSHLRHTIARASHRRDPRPTPRRPSCRVS